MGPWDPNWRPDPSGRRLEVIRAARWGALLAAGIFGCLVVVATIAALAVPEAIPIEIVAGAVVALFSLPGLALLGAGLTPAALGTRTSAAGAGLAIAVGVPVAALLSAMIGAFIVGELAERAGAGSVLAGQILRVGVTAAVRISPLVALGSATWVLLVRRLGRRAVRSSLSDAAETLSRGGGPRPQGG